MALVIVHNDSVVLMKGYGVRTVGKPEAVDAHTLFAIASLTKAFTTTGLGMLVDQKKLSWDDRVTDLLPGFQLWDMYATREMTVRDLLCHRSGLATFGGDLIWYGTSYAPKEVIRRIRYLKPKYSFRANYGYQNVMFLAAGEILSSLSGRPWEDFVRDSIFLPLGMKESNTSVRALNGREDVATPHIVYEGKPLPVPYRNVDNMAPAAAVNSSVYDLAQWLRMWLRGDSTSGIRRISPATQHEILSAHTSLPISLRGRKMLPSRHFSAAGLGWFLMDYHGRKVQTHSGGMDGMISQIAVVPEEKLAFAILTNSVKSPAGPLANYILDRYLAGTERDWCAEGLKAVTDGEARAKEREQRAIAARKEDAAPSLPLKDYAGTYRSEMYGDVIVTPEKERLVVRFLPTATFVGDLTQWEYNTFQIELRDRTLPKGLVTFIVDASGKASEMKIDIPNPDFDFGELQLKRVGDAPTL